MGDEVGSWKSGRRDGLGRRRSAASARRFSGFVRRVEWCAEGHRGNDCLMAVRGWTTKQAGRCRAGLLGPWKVRRERMCGRKRTDVQLRAKFFCIGRCQNIDATRIRVSLVHALPSRGGETGKGSGVCIVESSAAARMRSRCSLGCDFDGTI